MSGFRPLFAREEPDSKFEEPHEGFPSWMHQSVFAWVWPFVTTRGAGGGYVADPKALRTLENRLRLDPPLGSDGSIARARLFDMMGESDRVALQVIDYHLYYLRELSGAPTEARFEITRILREGGSSWEPTVTEDGQRLVLTRRAMGPVREAISNVASTSDRVGKHLTGAWIRLAGRNPDPSGAYREAVRAVEAAAKPVVLPNDSLATLGKIIPAIRDKPEKWAFELGSPVLVADMAASIHRSQLDRHGTDDESVPLSVSREQADATVHLAITLSRYFVHGAFRRK